MKSNTLRIAGIVFGILICALLIGQFLSSNTSPFPDLMKIAIIDQTADPTPEPADEIIQKIEELIQQMCKLQAESPWFRLDVSTTIFWNSLRDCKDYLSSDEYGDWIQFALDKEEKIEFADSQPFWVYFEGKKFDAKPRELKGDNEDVTIYVLPGFSGTKSIDFDCNKQGAPGELSFCQ